MSLINSAGLQITIHEAENLIGRNTRGFSDPFCLVDYSRFTYTTAVDKNTLNPKWNQSFYADTDWYYEEGKNGRMNLTQFFDELSTSKATQKVYVTVYSKNWLLKNDFLGYITIDLKFMPKLTTGGQIKAKWYELKSLPTNKITGRICVSIVFPYLAQCVYEVVPEDTEIDENFIEFPSSPDEGEDSARRDSKASSESDEYALRNFSRADLFDEDDVAVGAHYLEEIQQKQPNKQPPGENEPIEDKSVAIDEVQPVEPLPGSMPEVFLEEDEEGFMKDDSMVQKSGTKPSSDIIEEIDVKTLPPPPEITDFNDSKSGDAEREATEKSDEESSQVLSNESSQSGEMPEPMKMDVLKEEEVMEISEKVSRPKEGRENESPEKDNEKHDESKTEAKRAKNLNSQGKKKSPVKKRKKKKKRRPSAEDIELGELVSILDGLSSKSKKNLGNTSLFPE